ncbi:hypothetical protein TRFO_35917 [Tritrichomonas foetus]|uniref:RING-type domain-containing protein n=1 Tax=Tritrichomonas foetus TaxID=1144522 RepID=A0A1J4JJT0_9EUKA|nr:hypothetical protein TRFO_35917 [Tritrichomonas foetus]|eukprot:OHS97779.1 hypothetical protein TRFO_35917 [Tritrichomonas foetus]
MNVRRVQVRPSISHHRHSQIDTNIYANSNSTNRRPLQVHTINYAEVAGAIARRNNVAHSSVSNSGSSGRSRLSRAHHNHNINIGTTFNGFSGSSFQGSNVTVNNDNFYLSQYAVNSGNTINANNGNIQMDNHGISINSSDIQIGNHGIRINNRHIHPGSNAVHNTEYNNDYISGHSVGNGVEGSVGRFRARDRLNHRRSVLNSVDIRAFERLREQGYSIDPFLFINEELVFRPRAEREEQMHRIDEMSDEASSIIARIQNRLDRVQDDGENDDDEFPYNPDDFNSDEEIPESRLIMRSIRNKEVREGGECVICLSEFLPKCEIAELPCGHIFHPECIQSWVKKHPTCPICRSSTV